MTYNIMKSMPVTAAQKRVLCLLYLIFFWFLLLKYVKLETVWRNGNHKQEHVVQSKGFYPKKILNKTQMMMNYIHSFGGE